MAEIDCRVPTLTLRLGDDLLLQEAPGAGVAWCGDTPQGAQQGLAHLVRGRLEEPPAEALHRLLVQGTDSVVSDVIVTMEPPGRQARWTTPTELKLHFIRSQLGELLVARVPVLDIEVFAKDEAELQERLASHIRTALQRSGAAKSIGQLMETPEPESVELGQLAVRAKVHDPEAAEQEQAEKKSVLESVTSELVVEPAWEVQELVAQLAALLTGHPPQHVLLVGPAGVGKTAIVRELVRRRAELGLGAVPFRATTGTRLVAGMSGFGEWQERVGEMVREAAKQRAVLHFGQLHELLQSGRHSHNTQGIASFLRPHLARGEFLALAECTPEQIPVLEREDPHLLEVFVQLVVAEPERERGRRILAKAAPGLAAEALEQADALHRRYATASAYPGRPLRFLRHLLRDHPTGQPDAAEILEAFGRETGLPRLLLDETVPLELAETRRWFETRVIGQPVAVTQVVDLLAVVKKRLARPRKPLASLLFIGPTGVGKTEMARSLAAFLFSDPERVTRFDMSEFASPAAVHRLIGGAAGEGLLTSKVREEPFSVLLFDEFEKAHPLFFDLLLPVLGEGRLTDSAGRLADFTNAVVILTSNLGATSFQSGRLGFATGQVQRLAREHFTNEVQRAMRPELFNRFDRIVPFSPLDQATVLAIADRELALLRTRDGLRFRDLEIGEGVAAHFARTGFDVRYGARPLKRAIERGLLVPLAEAINSYPANQDLRAVVRLEGGEVLCEVSSRGPLGESRAAKSLALLARDLSTSRRDAQLLLGCVAYHSLGNERARLEAEHRRRIRKQPGFPESARLRQLRELQERCELALATLEELETEVVAAIHERAESVRPGLAGEQSKATRTLRELMRALHEASFDTPGYAVLSLYGDDREWLLRLARAAFQTAGHLGAKIELSAIEAGTPSGRDEGKVPRASGIPVKARLVEQIAEYLASPPDSLLGLTFVFSGPSALAYWMGESGWHQLQLGGRKREHVLVAAGDGHTPQVVPEGIERRGTLKPGQPCRTYHVAGKTAQDSELGEMPWRGELGELLHDCLTVRLDRALRAMLEEQA